MNMCDVCMDDNAVRVKSRVVRYSQAEFFQKKSFKNYAIGASGQAEILKLQSPMTIR